MPSFKIRWIDLGGLLTVVDNLLIVTILKLLNVLIRLNVLKLPEAKLMMADAEELWLDVFWLFQQVHQDVLRLVERVLVAMGSTLVIESF